MIFFIACSLPVPQLLAPSWQISIVVPLTLLILLHPPRCFLFSSYRSDLPPPMIRGALLVFRFPISFWEQYLRDVILSDFDLIRFRCALALLLSPYRFGFGPFSSLSVFYLLFPFPSPCVPSVRPFGVVWAWLLGA